MKPTIFRLVGAVAGLLYLGSGFMILMQMIIALKDSIFNSLVILAGIFLFVPLLLGFALLRKIIRIEGEISMKDRLFWLLIGVLGLFMWSGLFLGPALSILSGLYPSKKIHWIERCTRIVSKLRSLNFLCRKRLVMRKTTSKLKFLLQKLLKQCSLYCRCEKVGKIGNRVFSYVGRDFYKE
ncbi:MAG: hypothetical protein ACFFGP_15785 [Promethearchaeota archaeon]